MDSSPIATSEQVYGPLRNIVPVLAGLLTYWGLDSVTAGLVATGVLMLVSAAWSFYQNRPAGLAKTLTQIPGVQMQIAPNAPKELRKLASDPKVDNIEVKS